MPLVFNAEIMMKAVTALTLPKIILSDDLFVAPGWFWMGEGWGNMSLQFHGYAVVKFKHDFL